MPGTLSVVPVLFCLLTINAVSAQSQATSAGPAASESSTRDSRASQDMPYDGGSESDRGAQQAVVAISVVLGLVLLFVILFGAWILFRRWERKQRLRQGHFSTRQHLSPDIEQQTQASGFFPVRLSDNSYQSLPMSDEPSSDRPKYTSVNESLLTAKDEEAPRLADHPAFRNSHETPEMRGQYHPFDRPWTPDSADTRSYLAYLVPPRKPVGLPPKPRHESTQASISMRAQFNSNSTLGDWGFQPPSEYGSHRPWVDTGHQAPEPFFTSAIAHSRNISGSSTSSQALLVPRSRHQSMYYDDTEWTQDSLIAATPKFRPSTPLGPDMSPTGLAWVDVGGYERHERSLDPSPYPITTRDKTRSRSLSTSQAQQNADMDMDITEAADEDGRRVFEKVSVTWPVPKRESVPWQVPSTGSVTTGKPQIAHAPLEHVESAVNHDVTSPDRQTQSRWPVQHDRPKSSKSTGVSRLTAEGSQLGSRVAHDGYDSSRNSLYDVSPNSEVQDTATAEAPLHASVTQPAGESVPSRQIRRNPTAASASSTADSIMTATTASPFTKHIRKALDGRRPAGDDASCDVASEAILGTGEEVRRRRQTNRSRSPFNLDDFEVPQLSPIFGPDDDSMVSFDQEESQPQIQAEVANKTQKQEETPEAKDDLEVMSGEQSATDDATVSEPSDPRIANDRGEQTREHGEVRRNSSQTKIGSGPSGSLLDESQHFDQEKEALPDTTWGDPTTEESAFEQHGAKHTRRWNDGTESRSFNEMYGRRPVGSGRGSSLAASISSAAVGGDSVGAHQEQDKEENVVEEVVVMMKMDTRGDMTTLHA